MKEKVIKILVLIILFNYIFIHISFATAGEGMLNSSVSDSAAHVKQEDYEQGYEDGTYKGHDGNNYDSDEFNNPSTTGAVSGTIAKVINFIPLLFNKTINSMINDGGFIDYSINDGAKKEDFGYYTIEKIIFGKYYLFNTDLFKNSTDGLKVTNQEGGNPDSTTPMVETLDELRTEVSKWYYVMRLIALVIGFGTLIFIGIQMAISTVAEEQARYKKMLIGWIQSILIIVLLPYIISITNFAAKVLMDIINSIRDVMIDNNQRSFEDSIINMIYGDLQKTGGYSLLAKAIVFSILVWAEFKFFMMYIKRVIAVSFLIIISPLITITYSIDKAGDGQAQAFNAWIREFLTNIFIQPLQAVLYLIFVFSANSIAAETPMIGIIFLLSLTRAEKIVKTIFNLRGLVSLHTMKLFKKDK